MEFSDDDAVEDVEFNDNNDSEDVEFDDEDAATMLVKMYSLATKNPVKIQSLAMTMSLFLIQR